MAVLTQNPNVTPGDALRTYVEDNFHLPLARMPVTYQVQFIYKPSGRVFAQSKLALDAPQAILALRRATFERQQREERAGSFNDAAAIGYGSAPQARSYAEPPRSYTEPPLRAPYDDGREDVAYLKGQYQALLEETRRAAAEGRVARVPVEAPHHAPPIDEEAMTRRIAAAVATQMAQMYGKPAGFGAAPAAPIVASSPAPAAPVNPLMAMFEEMQSAIVKTAMTRTMTNIRESLTGEREEPAEAQPVVLEPAEKPSGLGFAVEEIPGAKWGDGRPVMAAIDKESGDILYDRRTLMANPAVIEKGMEVIGMLGSIVANAMGVKQPAQGAHVVGRIPAGAAPAGVGEAPQGEGEGWPGG
jgi:hypothetical protein